MRAGAPPPPAAAAAAPPLLALLLVALLAPRGARGAAFTDGNLVAMRVGRGGGPAAALTQAATAVFLDEYTPAGALVQSLLMPVTISGYDLLIGQLSRSADGAYLTFGALSAPEGTPAGCGTGGYGYTNTVPNSCFANWPRAIVRVDAGGNVAVTNLSASVYDGIIKGVCTYDGSGYYIVGNASVASGSAGVAWVPHGGSTATSLAYNSVYNFLACTVGGPSAGVMQGPWGNTLYVSWQNTVTYAESSGYAGYMFANPSATLASAPLALYNSTPPSRLPFVEYANANAGPIPAGFNFHALNTGNGNYYLDRSFTEQSFGPTSIAPATLSNTLFIGDCANPHYTAQAGKNVGMYKGMLTSATAGLASGVGMGTLPISNPPSSLFYPGSGSGKAFGPRSWISNVVAKGIALSADETALWYATQSGVFSVPTASGYPAAVGSSAAGIALAWSAATYLANTEYRGLVRAPFVVCPQGSYAAAAGLSSTAQCTACPPGSTTAGAGGTSAAACSVTCPAGYYCFARNVLPCPAGTSSLSGGSSLASCTPCPASTYAASVASAVCTSCPAGFSSSIVGASSSTVCIGCSPGTYFSAGSCVACAPGSAYAGLGGLACVACPAGFFAGGSGNKVCTPCASGTYSAAASSAVCTAVAAASGCAAGSYGPLAATSSAAASCTQCPAGTFQALSGQSACTPCPANTYSASAGGTSRASCLACAPGTVALAQGATSCSARPAGFTPGNLVALRLQHPQVQVRAFALTAGAWLDEYAAPTDPNEPLVLVQSVPLPNSSAIALAAGQLPLTIHGQDLQSNQALMHGGMISTTFDGTSIVVAGVSAPVGTRQSVQVGVVAAPYTWSAFGLGSQVSTHNLVVGTVDYNARIDISTVVGLANDAAAGPAAFAFSATAPCTPGAAGCASGFLVATNGVAPACGPWYVGYGNTQGFTGASGSGSGAFSYHTDCAVPGGARTVAMVEGKAAFLHYYATNFIASIPSATWPPASRTQPAPPVAAMSFFTASTAAASTSQAGLALRQWLFVVPVGQTAVYALIADAGLGLRVAKSAINYPTSPLTGGASFAANADLTTYVRVPNNDHALVGLAVLVIGGRSTAYVTSTTGSVYSFDIASLSWNNNGFSVYSTGYGSSLRGLVAAPAPPQAASPCTAPPVDSATKGAYHTGWPQGFVLAGLTSAGASWGNQSAPTYASASFGCYAGFFGALTTTACSLVSGWPAVVAPTCAPCTAVAGSYCPPFSQSPTGVLCPVGFWCAGGTADRMPCTAPGGSYCGRGSTADAATSNIVIGYVACPWGATCLGGSAAPIAAPRPFLPNSTVVARLGDGFRNWGTDTQPVFLDEFDTTTFPWTMLQSLMLPVAANGTQQAFSLVNAPNGFDNTAYLTKSFDDRFIVVAGFAAPPGTPIAALRGPDIQRVIARVDFLGNVDTTTVTMLGNSSSPANAYAFSIPSACTYDGSSFIFGSDYMDQPGVARTGPCGPGGTVTCTNLWVGNMRLYNYIGFGQNVTNVTNLPGYAAANNRSIYGGTIFPGSSYYFGGGMPVNNMAMVPRQCGWSPGNDLVFSRSWSKFDGSQAATGYYGDLQVLPSVAGALSSSGAISGDPSVLNSPFHDRYVWDSGNPYAYNGWAFIDGGRRFVACDKSYTLNTYRDTLGGTGQTPYPLGTTRGFSNTTTAYLSPAFAGSAISSADSSSLCHGVVASRDGNSAYVSTASAGSSRIFGLFGWAAGGAVGTSPGVFSVAGNSYVNAPANAANRLGVANVPVWTVASRAAAAPFYKGLSQAPSGLTRALAQALFTEGVAGTSINVVRSATGPAGTVDIRCAPGFYGAPLLALSASGAAGLLSSLSARCTPCARPAALDASVLFLNSTSGGFPGEPENFLLVCAAGSYSPSGGLGRSTCVRDAATLTYTLPASAVCVIAPAGSYTPDGITLLPCPGGTFGSASGLSTPACSGQCLPGFYCPPGSTSATQFPCGAITLYCPAGAAAPLTCANGSYTGPLASGIYPAAPAANRYTCSVCPPNRLCDPGIMYPAVDFSATCPDSSLFVQIGADASGNSTVTNALVGPRLEAKAPGFAGLVTYNVSSLVVKNPGCPVNGSVLFFNASAGSFQIGATPVSALLCGRGIVATLTATRVSDPLETSPPQQGVCVVSFAVPEIAIAPSVLCNSSTSIPEFSPAQTVVSPPGYAFTNNNVLTKLLYTLVSVVPYPNVTARNPFVIDSCSGAISTVTGSTIRRFLASSYAVTVRADNFGMLPLLSTSCSMTINVSAVNLPPSLTTTSFLLFDQQPAGALVGSTNPTSPNGYTVRGFTLKQVQPTGLAVAPFGITSSGMVFVNDPTISAFARTIWVMEANFTDGIYWIQQNLTFTLLDSPRPPTCFPTTLNVSQVAPNGTVLNGGALRAVHPQGVPMTFAISGSGSSYFAANATTGTVSLFSSLDGASLPITNAYALQFTVTDANGKTAVCPLTAAVLIVYHPPTAPTLSVTMNDGTSAGTSLGAVAGSTVDNGVTLAYSLLSCAPLYSYGCPFAIDALSGSVLVAPAAGRFAFNNSAVYPTAKTFTLTVLTRANGIVPSMNCTSSVFVAITNIAPYFSFPASMTVPGYTLGGSIGNLVGNILSSVITPAGQSRAGLAFAVSTAQTFEGVTALQLNANGDIIIQSNSWNLQTTPFFLLPVLVSDSNSGQSASGTFKLPISHYNQAPVWVNSTSVAISAIAATAGPVGPPLLSYVFDWDVSNSAKGDNLTFTIQSGNVNGVFAINPRSGQLSVVNPTAAELVFGSPNFLLGVRVTDAGIDSPALSADASFTVNIVPMQTPPSLPSSSFSIAEHSAVGTLVGGRVTGATSVPCISASTCSTFSYALIPAGGNVNQPWPFSVNQVPATSPTWGLASCQIVVSGGPINFSPFDGQGLFRIYNGTLLLSEQRLGVGLLTASAPVTISVTYVAEPPFFSPVRGEEQSQFPSSNHSPLLLLPACVPLPPLPQLVTQPPATPAQLNSVSFTAFVNEHAAPGSALAFVASPPSPLAGFVMAAGNSAPALAAARSKDPAKALVYSLNAASPVFSINASTGLLVVAAAAADIRVATAATYSLSIRATDPSSGLFDTASVLVNVVDVNDAATLTGVFDASGAVTLNATAPVVRVNETLAVGSVVAIVRFADADTFPTWAAKVLSVSGSGVAGLFAIDQASGNITLLAPGLSFNDQANFTLTVSCSDLDPVRPLVRSVNISVQLVQQNRVAISGFAAAAGALPGSYQVASAFPGYATLSDVLFATTGSSVTITGTGFGLTGARLAAASGVQQVPTVTFGPVTGSEYTAPSCTVSTPGSAITCAVPAGVGRDLLWRVSIGGFISAASARRTSYVPPVITSVSAAGGPMSTAGGAAIVVTGTSFGSGANGTSARLYYGQPGAETGPLGYSVPCTFAVAQTSLSCTSAPGVGAGLSFVVYVGAGAATAGQPGVANSSSVAAAVAYAAPTVSGIAGNALMDTAGGATFNITGTNMGPLSAFGYSISVVYGKDLVGLTQPVFTATACSVLVPHTTIACVSAPGVGAGFKLRLSVRGQAAADAPTPLAYLAPVVTSLSGQGLTSMPTPGGTTVILGGRYFGPAGLTLPDLVTPVNPGASFGRLPLANNFSAQSCFVSVKNTQITCVTAPGTGAGLAWSVSVGGQSSAVFNGTLTSYAPPTVAGYSGATLANTAGGEQVTISGYNFGASSSTLSRVTYGRAGGEFVASGCSVTVPHTQLVCNTSVGAGAGLTWTVVVDGQASVTPVTAYLPPIVDSFSGATNASTDGGELIVLTGRYFSTSAFLGAVTYGPGGSEYKAANCSVLVAHTQIRCFTVPGTGRALFWVVTVGNQTSARSAVATQYAAPSIASVVPSSGFATGGGATVTITGANLGLLYAASVLDVRVNALGAARPACLASYLALLNKGLPDDGSCAGAAAWLAQGTVSASSFNPLVLSPRGSSSVQFAMPRGFGATVDVLLLVDGVPSNVVQVSYGAPFIANAAPDRIGVPVGKLRLFIDGANFCSGAGGCGVVTVDGNVVVPTNYSDTRIVVVVADPASLPTGPSSVAVVSVGTAATGVVASNAVSFAAPVPTVSDITAQPNWGGVQTTVVTTAVLTFTASVTTTAPGTALSASAVLQPTVGGPMRTAVAKAAGLNPLDVNILTVVDTLSGQVRNVQPADPVNTVVSARRLAGAAGSNVTFAIDLVATAPDRGLTLSPASISLLQANLTAVMQSPALQALLVARVAAATGLPAASLSASIDASSFAAPQTTKVVAAGSGIPARGGTPFFMVGVANLYGVPATAIQILFGPFVCRNLTIVQDGDIGAAYGVSPKLADGVTPNPLATEYYTYRLDCITPPGVGAGLPIRISVPGGISSADPSFTLTYAAPRILAVVDSAAAAAGGNGSSYTGLKAAGFPTTGTAARAVRVTGSNFGGIALLQQLCVFQLGAAACAAGLPTSMLSVAVRDEGAARSLDATALNPACPGWLAAHDTAFAAPAAALSCACPSCGVESASFADDSFVFAMPPGQGAGIQIALNVAGQADTGAAGASTPTPPTLVRYLAPVVSGAFNPITGNKGGDPTVGGTLLRISGSNFGLAGFGATTAQGLPVVTIGGFAATVCDASCSGFGAGYGPYASGAAQNSIDVILPEGWGANLPVIVSVEGQSSTATIASTYSYAPPSVLSVSPASGPTSGLNADGSNITVTVLGANLGRAGALQFVPTSTDATAALITVPQWAVLVHNHTAIVFSLPEGAGANLQVAAFVGGATSAGVAPPVFFSYLPPKVLAVSSATSQLTCTPTVKQITAAGAGVPVSGLIQKSFAPNPGCFPTLGSPAEQILLSGQSFGAAALPVRVTIGGAACPVASHTHTAIICTLPNGVGESNAVVVVVGGRANVDPFLFAYDPPVLEVVAPSRIDASAGQGIDLQGHNFGPSYYPATVLIGGLPCVSSDAQFAVDHPADFGVSARWLGDGLIHCTTQADTVGQKNVSLLAANRTVPLFRYEVEAGINLVELRCPKGAMGLRGELCATCGAGAGMVNGALCPGAEMDTDLATALPGWWRFNSSTALQCASALQAGRISSPNPSWGWAAPNPATGLAAVPDPGCPVFVACEPLDSCLGANVCSGNYKGDRCQECATRFYRVNGVCIRCPDSPWATVVVFVLLALAAMFAAYLLNSKNVNLSLISIGTDWAQIVAMFARTRINWPDLVKQLFLLLSAFNFNLELIAPECAIPSVTYSGKWLFVEGMPIFAWLCLLTVYTVQTCFKALVMGRGKKDLHSHVYGLVATGVVVQRVLYLYMARSTLDVFNCSPSNPPDYDKQGNVIKYMVRCGARSVPTRPERPPTTPHSPPSCPRSTPRPVFAGLEPQHRLQPAGRLAPLPAALRRGRAHHLRRRRALRLALLALPQPARGALRPDPARAADRRRQDHEPALRLPQHLEGALHELPPGRLVLGVPCLCAQVPHRLLLAHVPRHAELPAGHGAARALRRLHPAGALPALPEPLGGERDGGRAPPPLHRGQRRAPAHRLGDARARRVLQAHFAGQGGSHVAGALALLARLAARRLQRRGRRRDGDLLRQPPLALRGAGARGPHRDPHERRCDLHLRLQHGRGHAPRLGHPREPRGHLL